MDYTDEVSHSRMFRWLAAKNNTRIKEVDLFNPPDDAIARSMPTGATNGQGQPSVETPHDQTTATDLGVSSGGIAGRVDVGRRHADDTPSHDVEHCKDNQDKLFEKVDAIAKAVEELKSKKGVIPSKKYVEVILCLMRSRQLVYLKAYDGADKIMDLNFYRNLKDRYDYLNNLASTPGGEGFYSLLSGFQWDEEMIKYVRWERPNPHDKSWTEEKRILGVMNVNGVHYQVGPLLHYVDKVLAIGTVGKPV
ncbi:hypothetical protein FXO38_09065 [Capsicum annuum]|nr:hypothetical protein FXO38_09065 [Capsicum annuum]